jgi:hypothetical protein
MPPFYAIAPSSIPKYPRKYEQAHKRSDGIHPQIPYSPRLAVVMSHICDRLTRPEKPSHGHYRSGYIVLIVSPGPASTEIILTMVQSLSP